MKEKLETKRGCYAYLSHKLLEYLQDNLEPILMFNVCLDNEGPESATSKCFEFILCMLLT